MGKGKHRLEFCQEAHDEILIIISEFFPATYESFALKRAYGILRVKERDRFGQISTFGIDDAGRIFNQTGIPVPACTVPDLLKKALISSVASQHQPYNDVVS